MNKVKMAGFYTGSKLVMHINLTEEGAGWKEVEIPKKNRDKILKQLDEAVQRYRNDINYRKNIGSGENVDAWLKDMTTVL